MKTNNDISEELRAIRNAQDAAEYAIIRDRIVQKNKLDEGGYSPEVPYSLPKTEWRALCALCADGAWDMYGAQFTEELLTDTDRRNVLKVIKTLAEEGRPIDVSTAYTVFERLGINFPTDWVEWLTSTTHKAHLPYLIKDLKTMAKKREYDNTCKAAIAMMEDGSVSLETIGARLREIAEEAPYEEVATMEEAGQEVLNTIYENATNNKPIGTITGFEMLDNLGAFMAGDLIIVAGDTSNGKTSLALSITLNAIRRGSKIAYYSLEMSKKRLAARLLSMLSKVPSSSMLRKRLYQEDYDKVKEALDLIPKTELLFDDKATIKFEALLGSIRMMVKKYGVKGVVVDYLQILNVNDKGKDTPQQMMAEVARKLKNVAKECNIWVMALSQLSRDKANPVPTLTRLRDSGQIAEAADVVILVYRPSLYGLPYGKPFEKLETEHSAQIEIAKGRDIGLDKCVVAFDAEHTYFYDALIPEARYDNCKHNVPEPCKKFTATDENGDKVVIYSDEMPF